MRIKNIEMKWLGQSCFLIEDKKIIYIDPFKLLDVKKADIILITHSHYDHCNIEDLKKIVKDGTYVIMPADCQSKLTKLDDKIHFQILEPGQEVELEGITIKAVPAYNTNKRFHSKEDYWNGYVLTINGIKIYHAGDTDLIPEMSYLGKIDVALLPVDGKYNMNAEEAAKAAFIIKPELAVPMHYGSMVGDDIDADRFLEACKEQGIKAMKMAKG